MRKQLLTALAAGAVVLAGCAKIETTEVPEGRVIGFDNFVTNAVKSLDVVGNDGLTTFYVYGGPTDETALFDGTTVSYANDAWSYSPLKYWEASKTYNFAAYSNENGTAENVSLVTDVGANQYHLKIENYTSDGDKDLIYAYNHTIECNTPLSMPTVNLTFHHILSRVAFKFTKDAVSLTGTEIAVSNIQITSLNNQGTFTGETITDSEQYPYGAWGGQTGTFTQAFDKTGGNISLTDEAAEGQTDYEYLIPQPATGSGLTVTFTLTPTGTIVDENEVSSEGHQFTVTLPATTDNQWNPGYTYVYTAEINASNFGLAPIIFDVTEIKGWSDGTISDGDILDDDITGTI